MKDKPSFLFGNSLVFFGCLVAFVSIMSMALNVNGLTGFTTVDLNESVDLTGFTQLPAEINQEVTWINNQTQELVKTAPPEVVETEVSEVDGKLQKTVTISSDLHYENILTYTSLPELLSEQVKLYWMIDGVKTDVTNREDFNITFYDENNNELIDKISWITPHLSEQEFILEFDITVINPWEYGVSGGEWIVYFNTTGTGKLNITKDDLSNSVLTFNYLKCGFEEVNYTYVNQSYIVENYTCSDTAEISHTIVEMPNETFSLQFDFGNDLQNDVDFAYDPFHIPPDEDNDFLEVQTGAPEFPFPGTDPQKFDTDGDGVIDGDEFLLGTDPLVADTSCGAIPDSDGDCLSDPFEQLISRTNAHAADSDGGGVSDYLEIQYSYAFFISLLSGGVVCDLNNPTDDVPCAAASASNTAPVWATVINDTTVVEDSGATIHDSNLNATTNAAPETGAYGGACTDADGDALIYTVTDPGAGQVDCAVTAGGSLSFYPVANWNGADTCTVRCSDGTATVDNTFTITVSAVNDTPTWTQIIPDQTVDADSSSATVDSNLNSTGNGHCTDVEGDSLSFSVETHTTSEVTCTVSTLLLSQQPTTDWSGTATCTIRCSDGNTAADDTFNIVVQKTIAMSMSTNLANDLDWAISNTTGPSPGNSWDASENNGIGVTGYYVTIEAHGGEPNVTIKSSGALSKGSGTDIGLGNYTYKNSTTNTVPGSATDMTTSYVNAATDLTAGASHNVYFKFFLTIPNSTAAGTYTTTTYFQGVV